MSLVDYDVSSEEEESEDVPRTAVLSEQPPPPPPPPEHIAVAKSHPGSGPAEPALAPRELQPSVPNLPKRNPVESRTTNHITSTSIKLPDAALLFSSPFSKDRTSGDDHAARVAAAKAENALRKRASNGPLSLDQPSKHRKGVSAGPMAGPNAKGCELLPPQLQGRSNVVTEDINKLFVRKRS